MGTLRERQSNRQQGQTQNQQSQPVSQQSLATAFPSPIHATADGEHVRVVAFGDLPGYSPAYLCVDKTGDSVWVPMEQIKIIDPNALPLQGR